MLQLHYSWRTPHPVNRGLDLGLHAANRQAAGVDEVLPGFDLGHDGALGGRSGEIGISPQLPALLCSAANAILDETYVFAGFYYLSFICDITKHLYVSPLDSHGGRSRIQKTHDLVSEN